MKTKKEADYGLHNFKEDLGTTDVITRDNDGEQTDHST